jgi:hypothetical protein
MGLQDQGGVCDLRLVEAEGCEKIAELDDRVMADILKTFQAGETWHFMDNQKIVEYAPRYPVGQGVRLRSVEVFEHAGNSAIYEG